MVPLSRARLIAIAQRQQAHIHTHATRCAHQTEEHHHTHGHHRIQLTQKLCNAYTTPFDLSANTASAAVGSTLKAPFTVSVKDNFCMVGHPTTAASKMLHDFKPIYNATCVEKLQDAGCRITGKTNMDEFGMGSHNTYTCTYMHMYTRKSMDVHMHHTSIDILFSLFLLGAFFFCGCSSQFLLCKFLLLACRESLVLS